MLLHIAKSVAWNEMQARKGKMKCIIGNGRNLMEWTYAGNVADAHILARPLLC